MTDARSPAFKDHFSQASGAYAAHRPTYPSALIDALAALCRQTGCALDAGCGSGQLSILLARRFAEVIATDASAAQLASAEPAPGVSYRLAPAERSGLDPGSVDLVVAAQAAHWFDLPLFYAEARRVGREGAVIALVTYGVIEAEPAIDPVVQRFYRDEAGPFWPPERRHVEDGYRSLPFPFEELPVPALAIEVSWTAADLEGYVGTWSALRGLERARGPEPLQAFRARLAEAWGDPAAKRSFRFPLSVRAGRVGV